MLYIESKYKDIDINIQMEIKRGVYYCILNNIFINSCVKNLGFHVFCNKKKYIRTISNLLSSWMFTLYSNYNYG